VPYLATTLTNQTQNGNIRFGEFGNHPEKRTLTNSSPGENAETLTNSARDKGVQTSNAKGHPLLNRRSLVRRKWRRINVTALPSRKWAGFVQGHSKAVHNAPQKTITDFNRSRPASWHHPVPYPQAGNLSVRNQHRFIAFKSYHLGFDFTGPSQQIIEIPHRCTSGTSLYEHSENFRNLPLQRRQGERNPRRTAF
jgi:hypothetical protein